MSSTYTTNILNPGTTTGGVGCTPAPYDKLIILIQSIHINNRTAGIVTARLFIGATGANAGGTDLFYDKAVGSNEQYIWYPGSNLLLTTADFLVGGASASSSLTITIMGQIGIG